MKKINLIWIVVLFFAGCDKGFEKLNQDPNNVRQKDFSPGYVFSTAELYTAVGEEETALYYGSAFVQQMASLSDVGIFNYQGDKYVYLQGPDEQLWKATYGSSGKLIEDVIQNTKEKPEFHNLYQMARIWKTMIYHRVTDMYGDIPYSDAGLAYYDQKYKPKYDAQKDIYANMLSELEDASNKLDPAQPNFASFDIVYGGNIARWKKLGYSMMLRLGMRLSKVDPSSAEAWVKKAYAGGVFSDNEDNVFIRGTDVSGAISYLRNGTSFNLRVSGPSFGKISKTYFDFMNSHNDPRLKHTVAVYKTPADISSEDTDPNIQKGLPNGLNRYTLENDPSYDASLPAQEHQYSGVKRNVYAKLDGPRMLITYPEMQFLLSEAAVRGWITANAKTLYDNGVGGAMKLLSQYDASARITNSEIENYLTANPFVGTGDENAALEQINTQFWATTFLNGYEAYANVRRSGYPVLVPVIYPDNETNGKFPRRLKYPLDERVLNADNYNEAVSRQGADEFLSPVWWDK